jgi:L-alanine-DL-glutamate epimerase-like enolase superfamily enzyme
VSRTALAEPEPIIRDGVFAVPAGPGLGVDVDLEIVERLRASRRA